ncbi:MAG TPA: acetamidase/formamidase family protein [Cyclobacteriaceae bacterium]|jgi:acetamidase/formamidase|nr:acetamidase/formamidase family protein [Cyclobacteriaceae bacterium]
MKYFVVFWFLSSAILVNGQSRSVEFKPTVYYNNFSHKFPAVLKVQPGDTVKSESVDAGGFDRLGKQRAKSGNPLTGPFFIEGALPGDVVAITLTKVSLNRGNASTVEGFIQRSLPQELMKEVYGRNTKRIIWKLDREKGLAYPEPIYDHLKNFTIPLHPFMGCVGVAAPLKSKEPLTYTADNFGGNMDFNRVTTGATIYLPVFHEGALLYIGDGHAAQGDGELNGDALETSMDFAFVAKVVKGKNRIEFPRIEDSEYIIGMAMDETMDMALKKATGTLLQWLQQDYNLTLQEATQVIGTSMEYRVPTLASPKYVIAAMIKKKYLIGINNK